MTTCVSVGCGATQCLDTTYYNSVDTCFTVDTHSHGLVVVVVVTTF